jgi:hypothetical protein
MADETEKILPGADGGVNVVLYSEEVERLITPSQFDKLNSFSTTLIRVLSQL